jgi:hypothetical protein
MNRPQWGSMDGGRRGSGPKCILDDREVWGLAKVEPAPEVSCERARRFPPPEARDISRTLSTPNR